MSQNTAKQPAKSTLNAAEKGAVIKLVPADMKNLTGFLNELVMIDLDNKRKQEREAKDENI